MNWFQRLIASGNSDAHKLLKELSDLRSENEHIKSEHKELLVLAKEWEDTARKHRNRCEELEQKSKLEGQQFESFREEFNRQREARLKLDEANTKTVFRCVELEKELTVFREITRLFKDALAFDRKREYPP